MPNYSEADAQDRGDMHLHDRQMLIWEFYRVFLHRLAEEETDLSNESSNLLCKMYVLITPSRNALK